MVERENGIRFDIFRAWYNQESESMCISEHTNTWHNNGLAIHLDALDTVQSRCRCVTRFIQSVNQLLDDSSERSFAGECEIPVGKQRFRVHGCHKTTFTKLLSGLEGEFSDPSNRLVLVDGSGRTVAPKYCISAHSTGALNAYWDRCCPVTTGAVRTKRTHHECVYMLKLVECKNAEKRRMHEVLCGKRTVG